MDAHTLNLLGALAVGCADLQESAMAEVDLLPAELAALLAVHARPGSTVGEVASAAELTHSGAVRVVDRLADAGRVERRTGQDRRTVALHCTREGRRIAKLALSLRRAALEQLTAGLGRGDIAALRRVATHVLSRLPEDRPHAWRICRSCDHGVCRGADCPVGSAVG